MNNGGHYFLLQKLKFVFLLCKLKFLRAYKRKPTLLVSFICMVVQMLCVNRYSQIVFWLRKSLTIVINWIDDGHMHNHKVQRPEQIWTMLFGKSFVVVFTDWGYCLTLSLGCLYTDMVWYKIEVMARERKGLNYYWLNTILR